MINKFIKLILLFSIFSNILYAQGNISNPQKDKTIYIVMLIVLLTWFALSCYIYVLNKKIKSLEKKLPDE